MDIKTTVTKELSWDFPDTGAFQASIVNGQLDKLRFCPNGQDVTNGLETTNIAFLKATYTALGEMFKLIEPTPEFVFNTEVVINESEELIEDGKE